MGLFGIMSYDEAMETLIGGTASNAVLEKAYKRVKKNTYNESQGTVQLHYCFGQLYGIENLKAPQRKEFSVQCGYRWTIKVILTMIPCNWLKGF